MITTNDESLADRLQILRCHGGEPRYYHPAVGINSRLDSLQAPILLAKFPFLDGWTNLRIANAAFYGEKLSGLPADRLKLPAQCIAGRHVFNQYTVRVANRDGVREKMSAAGVSTEIYYPLPLHLQECFAALGYRPGHLPASEEASAKVLSIPIDAELSGEEMERVADAVAQAVT